MEKKTQETEGTAKITFGRQEDFEVFKKDLIEHGWHTARVYYRYPLKDTGISREICNENPITETADYSLTDPREKIHKQLITYVCGGSVNSTEIRAFLQMKFNLLPDQMEKMEWPEIVDYFRLYAKHNGITKAMIEAWKKTNDTTANESSKLLAEPNENTNPPKEPTKEMNQAYLLYTSIGISQTDVGKKMKVGQTKISRWIKTVRAWRKHNNLPEDEKRDKPKINTNIDAAEKGKRTDGRKPTKTPV